MPAVRDVTAFLDDFAPATLAESWDNVGLLLGDGGAEVSRVMTCLTLTPDVAAEAVGARAGLIVAHHPIFFRPVKRLTTDTADGQMLLSLVKAGVAVYSPHTAFDSAAEGINSQICARLGLCDVTPLRPLVGASPTNERPAGAGRYGTLAETIDFAEFVTRLCGAFRLTDVDAVPPRGAVSTVAVACGAAADFLPDALRAGCDLLVTGEARFHAAIEARTLGIGLVLLGHYVSERFAVEELAETIGRAFPGLSVWPSRDERDPLERHAP